MLKNQILSVKSKQEATAIALRALQEKSIYNVLISNCTSTDLKLARKSAWVISAMFDLQSTYFKSEVNMLWQLLFQNLPSGVERSLIRIVSKFNVPEEFESPAFDLCMDRLTNANTAIANRAMAFDIAFKLTNKYAELKQELTLVIPLLNKLASPGLLVKVRRMSS